MIAFTAPQPPTPPFGHYLKGGPFPLERQKRQRSAYNRIKLQWWWSQSFEKITIRNQIFLSNLFRLNHKFTSKFRENCFSPFLSLGGMLLTAAANAGFEHPCLGGRGDEGIGGREGDHHHPPALWDLGGKLHWCHGCLCKFACPPSFFKFAPFRLG